MEERFKDLWNVVMAMEPCPDRDTLLALFEHISCLDIAVDVMKRVWGRAGEIMKIKKALDGARIAPFPEGGGTRMAKIFIDPGHGGLDNGAVHGYHEEDDYNLAIAFLLEYELRLRGMTVEMRRREDETVPLGDRVAMAQTFKPWMLSSPSTATRLALGNGQGIQHPRPPPG